MIYLKLKSSMLHHAEYEEQDHVLAIYFRVGKVRLFCDVPREVFDKLSKSWSPGRFYLKKIRQKYPRLEL